MGSPSTCARTGLYGPGRGSRTLPDAAMRFPPFAASFFVALLTTSRAFSQTQRIVAVDVVVACDEDEAARSRIEGQFSDLPVTVRGVAGGEVPSGAIVVTFETADDASRRITVTDLRTGRNQARRIELPDGPAALSGQRELVALTARRMVKALLDTPVGPVDPSARETDKRWKIAALAAASGSVGVESAAVGLRADVRALASYGGLRVDVGMTGATTSFDAGGYRWQVDGVGPILGIGVEHPWDVACIYVGLTAAYVMGSRAGEGGSAAPRASSAMVLPRLEFAYRRPLGVGIWIGISLGLGAQLPRVSYEFQGLAGVKKLVDSDVLAPSAGLQFVWDGPAAR